MMTSEALGGLTDRDLEEMRLFAEFLGYRRAYREDPEHGRFPHCRTLAAILDEQARRRALVIPKG